MVTGQNNMIKPESNKDLITNSNLRLSVQVSLNGLSFLLKNLSTNSVIFEVHKDFDSTFMPEEVLVEIKTIFKSNELLNVDVDELIVFHQNNLSCLVPKPLFDDTQPAQYLNFNSKIYPTDYVDFDELEQLDLVNVYIPFANINNYFFERFGAFKFLHFSTYFIEKTLNNEKIDSSKKMYIHLFKKEMSVLITKGKSILLYNTFLYNTPEDFLYYTLFLAEQIELNPDEFNLTISGKINVDDDYYKLAYKYIRNISIQNVSEFPLTKFQ